uniref:C-type lectin domain-containing protein n=1 Tax=Branchiostoma floridae TaxID=7739 RepID=C3YTJ2_BRAFL|eukprot:XP_002600107.1 hypothetical protein BRAFLDRAFT_66616 [Branchiostoma floridae]
MDNNVYREACNVYDSCNEDGSNEYEEACNVYDTCYNQGEISSVSPSRISAARSAPGLNTATGTSGVSGESGLPSSQTNDNRNAADTGRASAYPAWYIPGVGMRGPGDPGAGIGSPGQSRVWTCAVLKAVTAVAFVLIFCLMGTVIFLADEMSDLKLTVSKLDKKTEKALHEAAASVVQQDDSEIGRKTLHRQKKLEKIMTNLQDKPKEEYASTHLLVTCPDGYKKYREVCYKAFDTGRNFSEAAETCQADGGTLAMPRDAGIDAFLVSLKNAVDPHYYFWFGLHDRRQEGKWEWIDDTALGTEYSWWVDRVSIYDPERRDCALYRVKDWLPWLCDWAFLFICQVMPSG